jgi:glycosyltransferase involved in cell wall biosynthesis
MRELLLDLTPLAATSSLRGIGRYVRGLIQGFSELAAANLLDFRLSGLAADASLSTLTRVTDLAKSAARPPEPLIQAADFRRNLLVSLQSPHFFGSNGSALHLTDPKGFPIFRAQEYTLTCHDLISLSCPELYLPKIPGWPALVGAIERTRYLRARRVLAVSAATKRDLVQRLGVDAKLIDVVWHGVDHERFHPRPEPGERERVAAALGHEEPYVLYLGAGDARKDLDTLLSAYAASRVRREARLVIAGRLHPARLRELAALAADLDLGARVTFTGYIPEALIPALYRTCRVHVFPSLYEGFGLPVLEALASGAPTITSPGSSLDEVAGDAAELAPFRDRPALAAALERLFFDEARRSELRERGLIRARGFTWRRSAEQTLAFWRRAYAS